MGFLWLIRFSISCWIDLAQWNKFKRLGSIDFSLLDFVDQVKKILFRGFGLADLFW